MMLRGSSGFPNISYRGWRRCGAIGASGISGASGVPGASGASGVPGASGAPGGVAGVEPNSMGTDLGGDGVNLSVGRPNSNYLESVEEFF